MTQLGPTALLGVWRCRVRAPLAHLEDPSAEQVRAAVGALLFSAARECWSGRSVPASGEPANYGVVRSKGDDACSAGIPFKRSGGGLWTEAKRPRLAKGDSYCGLDPGPPPPLLLWGLYRPQRLAGIPFIFGSAPPTTGLSCGASQSPRSHLCPHTTLPQTTAG